MYSTYLARLSKYVFVVTSRLLLRTLRESQTNALSFHQASYCTVQTAEVVRSVLALSSGG